MVEGAGAQPLWSPPTSSALPPSSSCASSVPRPASPSSANPVTRGNGQGRGRRSGPPGRDVCIIDTAGRLAIDAELMAEVRQISEATAPHYTFLVIDAMTGQDAVATANAFHATLALDGVILTSSTATPAWGRPQREGGRRAPDRLRLDGEKLADFDLFHPDRMADGSSAWATC